MTEILFSKNEIYTNVITRLEVALSGKQLADARVSLSKSTAENGEVLYKATVRDENNNGLGGKIVGLCRAVTRHSLFLQNKAEKPTVKANNWDVFCQLLKNEAAEDVYLDAQQVRQTKIDEALGYISQLVFEDEQSNEKGLKFSSLKRLNKYLRNEGAAIPFPSRAHMEPVAQLGVSSALLLSSVGFQLARGQTRYVSDDNFRLSGLTLSSRGSEDAVISNSGISNGGHSCAGSGNENFGSNCPVETTGTLLETQS
ncbi:hypothetical protein [Pseudovibrio sp. Tun.PSC04-5.I4]|uniref:hypothetical protein n=1 Tax=Pseudovibrio sp. Tun.PSC04-5.I4 TaxID=1798213 RepID=UPI00117ACD17|nr:hypothetical protein [Pseudovibrio sp. Tun.PSC04-5.I4]